MTRIAVLSDIHGNWTALQAVARDVDMLSPDVVVQGGDLLGNFPRQDRLFDFIADRGWTGVLGNTDEMLWRPERIEALADRLPALQPTWQIILEDIAAIRSMVGDARLDRMKATPLEWTTDGITMVHASPGDPWTSPAATAPDEDLARAYATLGSALVVYGHIHQPFIRPMPGFTVANSGSVGLPYDGDPRASYLLIDDGTPSIRRVAYDIELEVRSLVASGYRYADWIATILRGGRYVSPTSTSSAT